MDKVKTPEEIQMEITLKQLKQYEGNEDLIIFKCRFCKKYLYIDHDNMCEYLCNDCSIMISS